MAFAAASSTNHINIPAPILAAAWWSLLKLLQCISSPRTLPALRKDKNNEMRDEISKDERN
jgi:hypothetical protein